MSKSIARGLDALVASAARIDNTVEISGGEVLVRGLTVLQFIGVIRAFPKIRSVLLGSVGTAVETEDATAARFVDVIVECGPEAMAAIVAAGMGKTGDKAVVAAVLDLPDEDLVEILGKVIDLTMPNGLADFFGRFRALADKLGLTATETTEDTAEAA